MKGCFGERKGDGHQPRNDILAHIFTKKRQRKKIAFLEIANWSEKQDEESELSHGTSLTRERWQAIFRKKSFMPISSTSLTFQDQRWQTCS